MAKLEARPRLNMEVRLILTLDEALALDGIAGYGDDAFIKTFKENLGTHYIRDHEKGLRSFLKTVRSELGFIRDFSSDIESICNGTKVAVYRDSSRAKEEVDEQAAETIKESEPKHGLLRKMWRKVTQVLRSR